MKAMKNRGFTIVELLIVIVIIGILAALVITAYNGLQQRANNTQTIDVARKYTSTLQLYLQDNGFYPRTTDNSVNTWVCLGVGYTSSRCANMTSNPSSPLNVGGALESSVFNAKIAQYVNNRFPLPSLQQVTWGGQPFAGIGYWFGSGATVSPVMMYWLSGDVDCPSLSGGTNTKSVYDGNTRCSWTATAP